MVPTYSVVFKWTFYEIQFLTNPRVGPGTNFFGENKCREKQLKYVKVDSVFYADSEYVISSHHKPHVSVSNTSQKDRKLCLNNSMMGPISSGQPWKGLLFNIIFKVYLSSIYTEKIMNRYFVFLVIRSQQWWERMNFPWFWPCSRVKKSGQPCWP